MGLNNIIKKIRSESYNRIVFKNIVGAFFIKGLSLLISFVSLPIYIKYFNDDIVLGLWFTLLSILTWLLTFDFGIGNGLRNNLVKSISEKNDELTKTYISSAYFYLGIIVLFIIVIITPIVLILNWNTILNIPINIISSNVLVLVVMINYLTIVFQFFFRLISFILYALQKSAINNFINFFTTVTQLIFVFIYKGQNNEVNLIVLSIVHMICVLSPLLAATLYVFMKKISYAKPSKKYINFKIGKEILFLGGKFFWVQITYLGLTGTNSFFISNIFNPAIVVEYQIYYRIFSLVGIVISLTLTPFWSIITKAKFEGKWDWIKKNFILLNLAVFFIIVFQMVVVFFLQFIFDIWLKESSIDVNNYYAIISAVFGAVFISHSILSTFANGFNKIKTQSIIYTIGLLVKIITLFFLSKHIVDWSYIVIIDILIFGIYSIIEFFIIKKYINLNISERMQIDDEVVLQ